MKCIFIFNTQITTVRCFKHPMMQSRLINLSNSISSICNPNVNLNQKINHSLKPPITCARTTNNFLRSKQRSNKTLIQLLRFAASNLHYVLPLPPPLDSVIRQFGGGGGGGGGGSGGFGWGGFDGGGGGRKRRVNKKSKLWVWGLVVCCLGFWWLNLNLGKLELKSDVLVLGAMCLSMFLVLIRNRCVPEWVLGFCSGAFVAGLLFDKKYELQKLFKATRVSRSRRGRRPI